MNVQHRSLMTDETPAQGGGDGRYLNAGAAFESSLTVGESSQEMAGVKSVERGFPDASASLGAIEEDRVRSH